MLGVVGKEDRPKPAVVIFRDAADEPCRIVAHYSLRSLFDDLVGAGGQPRHAVRIVRAPHHVVDADDVAQANADGAFVNAQHDVRRKKSLGLMPSLAFTRAALNR